MNRQVQVWVFLTTLFFIGGAVYAGPGSMALDFDGDNDYIEIPDHDAYSITETGELTISFWVRPDTDSFPNSIRGEYINILGKGYLGEHEWNFRVYNEGHYEDGKNRIGFSAYTPDGKDYTGVYYDTDLEAGKWKHMTATVSDERVRIYENGVLRDEVEGKEINLENGVAPLMIGTRNAKTFFDGTIVDVAFFDKELSKEEVKGLYQGGLRNRLNNEEFSSDLVGFFKLNDDDKVITDYSSNKNRGFFYSGDETADPKGVSILEDMRLSVEELAGDVSTPVEEPAEEPSQEPPVEETKEEPKTPAPVKQDYIVFDGVDDYVKLVTLALH